MAHHTMGLKPEFFAMMCAGKKYHEGRAADEKRLKIAIGDVIEFTCGNLSIERRVLDIIPYENMVAMCLDAYDFLLPGYSFNKALSVYANIPNYRGMKMLVFILGKS